MTTPSHITTKMWKTWIVENPELAIQSAERFAKRANELGMLKKVHDTDGYVYLVAALKEEQLDQYYA